MDKTINQIAEEYLKAKAVADDAVARKEKLAEKLKEYLSKSPGEVITVDETRIALQIRETISFDPALISYLNANGLKMYIHETVNDAELKKAIKKSDILKRQIAPYVVAKQTQVLTAKTYEE